MNDFFLTSYCNQYHRVSDGKPLNHECYILPPAALRAEWDENYEKAQELLSKMKRVLHQGIKDGR